MTAPEGRSLAGIGLFEGLDPAVLRRLESHCRWRRFPKGEAVIEQGGESRDVWFVVEGAVNILNLSPAGREIAFATIEAGGHFGELSAIDAQPRSARVVAQSAALLAVLPAQRFVDLLRQEAEVTFRLLHQLTHMVRVGDVRIMELSTLAASHRVYVELLRMAVPDPAGGDAWIVRPLPPLREIAGRVSTTRETVARSLSQLYQSGLMQRKGRMLYVPDREKLEDFIEAMKVERL